MGKIVYYSKYSYNFIIIPNLIKNIHFKILNKLNIRCYEKFPLLIHIWFQSLKDFFVVFGYFAETLICYGENKNTVFLSIHGNL